MIFAGTVFVGSNISFKNTPSVNAQTVSGVPITGWAWSSNIGWIKFNPSPNGDSSKDVTLSTTTASPTIGTLNGYAWSSNIGWIKFGGLSDIPNGGSNATVDLRDGKVSGFIRACSGTVKMNNMTIPGDCSESTSRTDGWNGWIELSGSNHASPDISGYNGTSTKGVTLGVNPAQSDSYGKFSGYAWGGDVVGWISFKPQLTITSGGVTCGPNPASCPIGGGTPVITGDCSVSPGTIDSGGTVTATAVITNTGSHTLPYKYIWTDGTNTSTHSGKPATDTYSTSYTNDTGAVTHHTISVSVTDSSTPTPHSNTPTYMCSADVTVNPASTPGFKLFLKDGVGNESTSDPDHVNRASMRIKKGSKAFIGLDNLDVSKDYSEGCKPTFGFEADWQKISGNDANTFVNNMVSSVGTGLPVITDNTGTYDLRMYCENIVAGVRHSDSRSAKLQIYSTSINER